MDKDFQAVRDYDLIVKLTTHTKVAVAVEQAAQDYPDKKEPMMV
jgi:hypothetical protein